LEALRSAEALNVNDVSTLFEHLYSYNCIPLTQRWRERIPDPTAVRRELGLHSAADVCALLEEYWFNVREEADNSWLIWVRPEGGGALGGTGPEIKLYVSPAIDSLEIVFPELIRVVTFCRARSVKAGADAAGLLRPDKLVAYFSTMGDLAKAAHELAWRLDGVPPHGVPFTAEIFADGLLSWGVDPPTRCPVPGKIAPSWREWVCYRLAVALIDARKEDDEPEPHWHRALERLREQGVQIERWLPSPAYWGNASW
jgi:hypothetical protein